MLKDVRSGHVTGLIFSKLARLARNTKELLEFSDIFRACDADLISLYRWEGRQLVPDPTEAPVRKHLGLLHDASINEVRRKLRDK
jgi:hypothetical protein